jgi:hypothetical protein
VSTPQPSAPFAAAADGDALEQARLGERIVRDEVLDLAAVVGIVDDYATMHGVFGAIYLRFIAAREFKEVR